MKKVLHITNWYPNKWDNIGGIFIQEQYKVFSKVIDINWKKFHAATTRLLSKVGAFDE